MKLFKFLFICSLLALVSCSKGKKNDAEVSDQEVVSEDADFIVDAEDDELLVEDDSEILVDGDDSTEVASAPEVQMTEDMGTYQVKRNDTLMMIAFKIYGDYRMWKNLRDLNGLSGTGISEGMTIKYNLPSSEFSWNPEGLPYLIKVGDSLVTISNDKYGTPNKWKSIYNNNRPLIRDPNLIFAGFTLYYIPERDIASE